MSIREVSDTLSAARRDLLLTLQRREDLKSVLLEKLKKSFSCSENAIEKEVAYFAKRAKITDANLARLERRVRHREQMEENGVEIEDFDISTAIPYDAVSSYSLASSMTQLTRSESMPCLSKDGRLSRRPAPCTGSDLPCSYDWSRLDSYAQLIFQHDEKQRKEQEMDMRQQLRDKLDQQILERERMSQAHVHDDQHYTDNINLEIQNWQMEESRKQENTKQLQKRETEFWDWQNECGRMLKADAKKKERREAQQSLDKISDELQLQKKNDAAKYELEQNAMSELARENEEKKRRQREARKANNAQDMADQQEAERAMHEKDMKKKLEAEEREKRNARIQKMQNAQVQDMMNAQKTSDADLARQQAENIENLAQALEDAKASKRHQMLSSTQDTLFQQMEEKRCKKERDKELGLLLATTIREDVNDFTRCQEERKLQRRLQNLANRTHLENQIREKATAKTGDMSSREIILNADLIRIADRVLRQEHRINRKHTRLADLEDSSKRVISQITFG